MDWLFVFSLSSPNAVRSALKLVAILSEKTQDTMWIVFRLARSPGRVAITHRVAARPQPLEARQDQRRRQFHLHSNHDRLDVQGIRGLQDAWEEKRLGPDDAPVLPVATERI